MGKMMQKWIKQSNIEGDIVNIIQDNSIKEDVVFNIPSNLKRVS